MILSHITTSIITPLSHHHHNHHLIVSHHVQPQPRSPRVTGWYVRLCDSVFVCVVPRVASSRTPRAKCKLQCTAPVISDTDHLCPTPSLCQSGTVPPLPQWRGCCYSEHSPVSVNHTLGVCRWFSVGRDGPEWCSGQSGVLNTRTPHDGGAGWFGVRL